MPFWENNQLQGCNGSFASSHQIIDYCPIIDDNMPSVFKSESNIY